MKTLTRIQELKARLSNLSYTENGQPIGINPSEYVAICEELETLENE
jgi:hypothetical protein